MEQERADNIYTTNERAREIGREKRDGEWAERARKSVSGWELNETGRNETQNCQLSQSPPEKKNNNRMK